MPEAGHLDRWRVVADMHTQHHERILRWLTAKTNNLHLAEDLTSEVFLRAYTKLHLFDGRNPGGWLQTIARNTFIDYTRSERVRKELLVDEIYETAERFDPDSDPVTLCVRAAERQQLVDDRIRAILAVLTVKQRQVMELTAKGLTIREIAAELVLSEGAVKLARHRSTVTIKAHIRSMETAVA